ncbi:MAG: hypothetical protein IJH54_05065, partial [Clostridia bacterium]|nr:hypothetical protein [Clostridia bacterium]
VLTGLYTDRTAPVFRQPDSVIRVRLDGYTMDAQHETVLATAYTPDSYGIWEYFIKGTEPTEQSPYWSMPEPPRDVTLSRSGAAVVVRFTPPMSFVRYLLYRETADGYTTLLSSFEGADAAVFTDDVSLLSGTVSYYVIGVHPAITVEGTPLSSPASEKVSLFLYAPDSFLNTP